MSRHAAASLVLKTGEEGSVFAGRAIQVGQGQQFIPVGEELRLTVSDAPDGSIRIKAVFEHSEATGPAGNPRVTSRRAEATEMLKPGGTLRLELPGAPNNQRRWVDLTVRQAKP